MAWLAVSRPLTEHRCDVQVEQLIAVWLICGSAYRYMDRAGQVNYPCHYYVRCPRE